MEFPQPQKSITENFLETIDKHAPLKKKFVRGNQAPFMNREYQKAIYTRTRLKNKNWRDPFSENKLAYKNREIYVYQLGEKVLQIT